MYSSPTYTAYTLYSGTGSPTTRLIGGSGTDAAGNTVVISASESTLTRSTSDITMSLNGVSYAAQYWGYYISNGVSYPVLAYSTAIVPLSQQFMVLGSNSYATSLSTNGGSFNLACYAAGTRIATPDGEVAIEALRVGDAVLNAEGEARDVTWTGHRTVACARHDQPDSVWPVRIAAGAVAPRAPHRDLLVSPDHAVLLDGLLVPARALVNGATITQVPVETITWWHLELASHDAILAEGLAAETYLDTGNRSAFADQGKCLQLHPRFGRQVHTALACAPFAEDGPMVARLRDRLAARAGELGHVLAPRDWRVEADGVALAPAADGWVLVPDGTSRLGLRSDVARPIELEAGSRDTRHLGLCLTGLQKDGQDVALDHPALFSGFHAMENDGAACWRWTDGNALIDAARLGGKLRLRFDAPKPVWRQAA